MATLSNGALATPKSFSQPDLQSEASDQICVDMNAEEATVEFEFSEPADGMVIRYSVPDGDSSVIGVYNDDIKITSLTLTSKWSWEYLWNNGDPNNNGITNRNPRMRFDEVRYQLPEKLSGIKLVKESGSLWLDFVEMEPVPEEISPPEGAVVFDGDGSGLQAFIDANGGKTIFIPSGIYNINSQIYIGVPETKLQGAGMWHTQLNFTVTSESNGGLRANAEDVSYSDLYLTSEMTTRTNGYAGIHGVYTQGSTIENVWVEHCATGAWIGQYVNFGPEYADGFIMKGCRFRNTYADGINLCKGTSNAIVEHCNFRNNGDDGMAIWCAEGLECVNNTFRYNTVENGWRAAGAALYGGKDNKFYNIIIKDNTDVGITVANLFPGVGFNENGMHDFHNITLIACGTFNAIYNDRVGAINITHASSAGRKVQNVRFYNIDILDSKCDAIQIGRDSGEGISNLIFENINVDGTGKEFPFNNLNNSDDKRGYVVYFDKSPLGSASYCNLNWSNLSGNADGEAFNTSNIGSFNWTELNDCDITGVEGINLIPADTSIAGGTTFQLTPLFSPENATNKIVTYTSGNPLVATVSYDGSVTGLTKGETVITAVTQDGNFSATSIINVVSDPVIYYKIKNRWQNTYLYDAGDRVRYKTTATDENSLWDFEDIDGGKKIRNIQTGDYMHIEGLLGYVQCAPLTSDSENSTWKIEDAGDGYVRLQSVLNTNDYIHIEGLQNQAQYGAIETSWWSAMWELEPVLLVTSAPVFPMAVSEGDFVIYPNPAKGNFNMMLPDFGSEEVITVSVFNLAGQKIISKKYTIYTNGTASIQFSSGSQLLPGTYIVVARGASHYHCLKLIISE